MAVFGFGGFALMAWSGAQKRRADAATDPAALELLRLRRMVGNIVGVVTIAVLVVVTWRVVDDAERRADENADERVGCVLAGGENC